MRVEKFTRMLLGFASLFVLGVRIEEACIIATVRPSARRARCPKCGRVRPCYDHAAKPRWWVHLPYGELRFILEYTPRRVECPTCGVLVEQVPWARHDSKFTRPFEEMVAFLAQLTNQTAVSSLMGIAWSTVGNIISRVVGEKLDPTRFDNLKNIGVDEFSYRKRHRYITTVVDHDRGCVIWAREGKCEDTLAAFFTELGPERTARIATVTMDMSASFIAAVKHNAPKAQFIFDRFHVQKLASDSVDKVRRQLTNKYDAAGNDDAAKCVKKSRFALLTSRFDLSTKQSDKLADIQRHNAPLYRAYLLKEALADVFEENVVEQARLELDRWLAWASRSKLKPFVTTARTIRKRKKGILAYIETRLTNGRTEGFNSKLRMIARRAFGFHSAQALIGMLFLCCGGVMAEPPLPMRWCPW